MVAVLNVYFVTHANDWYTEHFLPVKLPSVVYHRISLMKSEWVGEWLCLIAFFSDIEIHVNHGPLARNVKLWVAHARVLPGTFSPRLWVSDPDMHHGTCVTHVPWCMPGSLSSGFPWRRWWGKLSRHSRRMCNPQFMHLVRGPCNNNLHMTSVGKNYFIS